MKIGFLGWGSLVWNPRELQVEGPWEKNGPLLPVEFARISQGERLTLVLYRGARQVPTLWAMASFEKLESAIRNLACREDTWSKNIGFIRTDDKSENRCRLEELEAKILIWAREKHLDAVVWTDLPSNFKEKIGIDFNPKNAVKYLKNLKNQARLDAEAYVRNAPEQINTETRKEIEKELAWTCTDDDYRKRQWSGLRKNLEDEKRIVKKAADDSYWIVVPQVPATFGHLLVISWKGLREQDITDKGLFTDKLHMQNIMMTVRETIMKMKNNLTYDGMRNGRKCERVYLLSECETRCFPFHFHLIPRFEKDRKGHIYLLERELEEVRWTVGKEEDAGKLTDGCNRIAQVEALTLFHRSQILSKEWVRCDEERKDLVKRIVGWAKLNV